MCVCMCICGHESTRVCWVAVAWVCCMCAMPRYRCAHAPLASRTHNDNNNDDRRSRWTTTGGRWASCPSRCWRWRSTRAPRCGLCLFSLPRVSCMCVVFGGAAPPRLYSLTPPLQYIHQPPNHNPRTYNTAEAALQPGGLQEPPRHDLRLPAAPRLVPPPVRHGATQGMLVGVVY